eukprot:jgi/Psemu1/46119/gm1.46119_g
MVVIDLPSVEILNVQQLQIHPISLYGFPNHIFQDMNLFHVIQSGTFRSESIPQTFFFSTFDSILEPTIHPRLRLVTLPLRSTLPVDNFKLQSDQLFRQLVISTISHFNDVDYPIPPSSSKI